MRHLLRNRGIRLIWPSFRPGMRNSTRNVNRGQKLLKCRFARLARPLKSASALRAREPVAANASELRARHLQYKCACPCCEPMLQALAASPCCEPMLRALESVAADSSKLRACEPVLLACESVTANASETTASLQSCHCQCKQTASLQAHHGHCKRTVSLRARTAGTLLMRPQPQLLPPPPPPLTLADA